MVRSTTRNEQESVSSFCIASAWAAREWENDRSTVFFRDDVAMAIEQLKSKTNHPVMNECESIISLDRLKQAPRSIL